MASSSPASHGQLLRSYPPHPYLLANLSSDKRTNGRAPLQPRDVQIHTSSLSHAHGSALIRVGDTTVICGVRGEILPVESIPNYRSRDTLAAVSSTSDPKTLGAKELKDYDLLVPNIELATGCAPQFLPGVPLRPLAQTLSTRVYSLLHSSRLLDVEDLEIWHNPTQAPGAEGMGTEGGGEEAEESNPELKAYWTLYIDLLFISFDGNPFDAAWIAVLAALRDTKLPAARWSPDHEMVVCSRKEQPKRLRVSGLPVSCTSAVFREKEISLVGRGHEGRHWLWLTLIGLRRASARSRSRWLWITAEGRPGSEALKSWEAPLLGIRKSENTLAWLSEDGRTFTRPSPEGCTTVYRSERVR